MIGVRAGIRVGIRAGVAAGISADPLGSSLLSTVSRDATSLKYAPASSAEWTTFMAAAGLAGGNPSSLWLCQEPSGNLADSIGSVALTVGDSPLFGQTLAGWTRKFLAITATTVQAFTAALGAGPNPATESVAWLLYVATTTTPGGNRNVIYGSGSAAPVGVDHIVSGNKLMIRCGANTTNSVGAYTLATAYPLFLVYNRTASSVAVFTDQEALTGTFAAVTDGTKGIGATQGSGDSSMKCGYITAFRGTAAEQFTTSGSRKLLTTAGFSIPW